MKAQLWIEHQWTPPLQRQGDSSIMMRISKLPYATTDTKTKCNMCRLYARVVTVADLAHLDGSHIPAARLNGQWRAVSSLTMWPNLGRPPKTFWAVFRKCIRDAYGCKQQFCHGNRNLHNKPVKLTQPLTAWLHTVRHIQYKTFRDQHWLYHIDDSKTCWRYKPTENKHVLSVWGQLIFCLVLAL